MSDSEQINISKLKFIGKIKKGEKIDTTKIFIQPKSMFTQFVRSWFNDKREYSENFIVDTIKKSFDELIKHLNKSQESIFDLNMARNIMTDLENCNEGLNNLKHTYSSDLLFCCKIDTYLQDIEARLEEIRFKYPFIKPKSNPINIAQPNSNVQANPVNSLNSLNSLNPGTLSGQTPPNQYLHPESFPDSLPSSVSSTESFPSTLNDGVNPNSNS
jgi:hypothetical protein